MIKDVQALKLRLQREEVFDEDEWQQKGEERLARILESGADAEEKAVIDEINACVNGDEVLKRKVLSYCMDACDPTATGTHVTPCMVIHKSMRKSILKFKAKASAPDKEILNHDFLTESELQKLQQFIKMHQHDNSFGETVFRIMDKHGLTAPEVYKNAIMRRQDFSRVTDFQCKSVTRRMAWQIIVGLHCTMKEADEVLFSAGYIRGNSALDITMQYFIENGNYDIEAIDAVLSEIGLKTFACD